MPRVSVLLPVRDAGARLARCLDSLAAQTLRDFEIVAVDDGSRDGSGRQLRERARCDPRLRVLGGPARGLVASLQLALAEARAPLVARMDADDVADPRRLALQVAALEAAAAPDILGCRVVATADAGTPPGEGMRAYVEWTNTLLDHDSMWRERFVESPIVHPSVAMPAATLRRLGGWRNFGGPEDYDLWLRAFDAGLRFGKLPQVLVEWHDSPGRLTRTDPRYGPGPFLAVKIEALLRGALDGRSVVVWGAGPIGKRWARALIEAGQVVRAFVEVDPRKIGGSLNGVPVVSVAAAGGFRGSLHLAAVGRTRTRRSRCGQAAGADTPRPGEAGARERIRREAARFGIVDGRDLFAVA